MLDRARAHRRLLIVSSFACIWLVWGSTFLTIRHVIHTIPPVLMCSLRLLSGGLLLGLYGFATDALTPRGVEWRNAALVGVLLPGLGNLSVTFGVAHVHSGLVALLVGTIPLWMALLGSFGSRATPPGPRAAFGLLLGFAGIAWLVAPGLMSPNGTREFGRHPVWILVPVAGSLSWAWGSLFSRRVAMPSSGVMSTAVGLTAAGTLQLLVAWGVGDVAHWQPAAVPWTAWAGLGWLVVFGSVLGFGSYLYLLRRVRPAIVATYAFVNPIVAMVLGWAFGGEVLGPRTLAAAAVVLAAVVLITTAPPPAPAPNAAAGLDARALGR